MTEAAPPIDRDAQMLARLAELDMAAAEHVHAKLMAASDADEIADLGRSYQRVSRSLRQTLALKAKLARDQATAASEAALRRVLDIPLREDFETDDTAMSLLDAVERIVEAGCAGDEKRKATLLARFDEEMDDWVCEDDFTEVELDAHVRRACAMLELPQELAARWRTLPRPAFTPDPATNDSDDTGETAQPPRPWSSSA